MAYMLLNIARHYTKSDDGTIKKLKAYCSNLAPKNNGMVQKNKRRLQQFNDPRQLNALLDLPEKMMKEACTTTTPTKQEARAAQIAVAVEILLMAPLRIKNISELEVGRTLFLNGIKSGYVLIAGSEVKNYFDIEFPLPQVTLHMIDIYLKRFHPLLAPPGSKMLFPSDDMGHKRTTVLSHQITLCVRRQCGIDLSPHLFRHLVAVIYLQAHPGAYGVIRLLLGHKNIGTTITTYSGTEQASAFLAYDKLVNTMRGGGGSATPEARLRRKSV